MKKCWLIKSVVIVLVPIFLQANVVSRITNPDFQKYKEAIDSNDVNRVLEFLNDHWVDPNAEEMGVSVLSYAYDAQKNKDFKPQAVNVLLESSEGYAFFVPREMRVIDVLLGSPRVSDFEKFSVVILADDVKMLKKLLANEEIDPTVKNEWGHTVLHIAVVKPGKRLRILKTLLADSRIDINEKDLSGLAPLDVAEKHSKVEGAIHLLHQDPRIHIEVEKEASVETETFGGEVTARRLIEQSGNLEMREVLFQDQMRRYLSGYTPNDSDGMRAAEKGVTFESLVEVIFTGSYQMGFFDTLLEGDEDLVRYKDASLYELLPQLRNSVDAVILLQQAGDERAEHFDKQQVLRNLDTLEMELQLKCSHVYDL